MPTRFRLRNDTSDINPGAATEKYMLQISGRTSVTKVTNTTAGGTNITATDGGGAAILEWYSAPLTEAVTISGTVTAYIRGRESANTVNAGCGFLVQRTDGSGSVLSTIVADSTIPATISEFSTSDAAKTGTYTPTSTNMSAGDRIKVTLKVRNVGTMAAGTVTFTIDGPSDAAAGGSYVQFNENFKTDDPIQHLMVGTAVNGSGYYQ